MFSYILYVLNVPSSSYFLTNSVQTKLSEVYMCLRVVKLYTPGLFLAKREIIERVSFKNVFHFVIYLWGKEFYSIHFFHPLLFSHYVFSDFAEHPTHTLLESSCALRELFASTNIALLRWQNLHIITKNAGVICWWKISCISFKIFNM